MDCQGKRFLIGDHSGYIGVYNTFNGSLLKNIYGHEHEIKNIFTSNQLGIIFSYYASFMAFIHADIKLNQIKLIKKLDFSLNEITVLTIDHTQENIIGFNNKFTSLNYCLVSSKKNLQSSEYQKVDQF